MPDFLLTELRGGRKVNVFDEYSGCVLLIVTVPSVCQGRAGQLQGLQKLYQRFRDQGLTVLGVVVDEVRFAELSTKPLQEACNRPSMVSFPVYTVDNGEMLRWLERKSGLQAINDFSKYLVSGDGQTVRGYPDTVRPENVRLQVEIGRLLNIDSSIRERGEGADN